MLSFLLFIIILAVLILIHEFGHFIAAKKNGILVEEFGFGFPPRLWGKKIGETLYSINLLPIGGFVKVFGEEYQELKNQQKAKLKNRAFVSKSPAQKTMVILAGVIMNVFLAVSIYYGLMIKNNFRSEPLPLLTGNYSFTFGKPIKQVAAINIIKNSPAEKGGISTEDIILRYRELDRMHWLPITDAQSLINIIRSRAGMPLELHIRNLKNGTEKIVTVTPAYDQKLKRAIIGVNLVDLVVLDYQKPKEKLLVGFYHSYNILEYNFKTIGALISSSLKNKTVEPVSQAVSGPVGILAVVHEVVRSSGDKIIVNLLNIMAMLSLSLAFVNVLPFPALDGGRLIFVFYEWLTKKPVNAKVERITNLAGIIALLSLAFITTLNDIRKFFSFFF